MSHLPGNLRLVLSRAERLETLAGRFRVSVPRWKLQTEVDRVRRELGLFDSAATQAWLKARRLGEADLLRYARCRVLSEMLQETAFGPGQVRKHFDRHRGLYDRALIRSYWESRFQTPGRSRPLPRRLPSVADRIAFRSDLPPEVGQEVFAGPAPRVIGPLPGSIGFWTLFVLRLEAARLDKHTRGAIRRALLKGELGDREIDLTGGAGRVDLLERPEPLPW